MHKFSTRRYYLVLSGFMDIVENGEGKQINLKTFC